MDRLKNSKVFLGKHSKEVQEKLFELGFKYMSGGKEFNFKVPFLFLDDKGNISINNNLKYFNNHKYEEVTPEYILSLEVKKLRWEDFGELGGSYVNDLSGIETIIKCKSNKVNKNLFPTREEAEACIALSQLCQWRDKYNEGWKADWTDYENNKYCIIYYKDEILITFASKSRCVLSFKSAEIRDKFLEDFRDLIEQAKPLL